MTLMAMVVAAIAANLRNMRLVAVLVALFVALYIVENATAGGTGR